MRQRNAAVEKLIAAGVMELAILKEKASHRAIRKRHREVEPEHAEAHAAIQAEIKADINKRLLRMQRDMKWATEAIENNFLKFVHDT